MFGGALCRGEGTLGKFLHSLLRFLELMLYDGTCGTDLLLYLLALEDCFELVADVLAVLLDVAGKCLSYSFRILCFTELLTELLVAREIAEDGAAEGAHDEGEFLHGRECSRSPCFSQGVASIPEEAVSPAFFAMAIGETVGLVAQPHEEEQSGGIFLEWHGF